MRTVIFTIVLIATGCAGTPAGPPTRVIAKASQTVPDAPATTNGGAIDPKVVLDAKRRGYTVVNENGEILYCHQEARTGSHLVTDITCLTEKEMTQLREQTQRGMQNTQLQLPPPQGR
jgi:hypothetical protein